ncbi:MAG: hypothetical protein IJ008_03845, partial [Clostridia bacterium]|nr:hypothetical protein [Clostridia bacterium]
GKNKLLITIISVGSAVILSLVIFLILFCGVWNVDIKAKAAQVDESQKIKVKWDVSRKVSAVEIVVSHNGEEVSTTKLDDKKDIEKGSYVVDAYYGNMDVTVRVKKGLRKAVDETSVKVFASEYNIAPITATMPVTLFSLNLKEITNDYTIPTFVWFKRSDVWDYSKLPNNVYTMPIASQKEITSNANQKKIYSRTSEWVKELYKINPDSHFNFFYNDYYAYGWMQATIANGIPTENYDVTLLSDGSASLTYFNDLFTADDADYTATYNQMKTEYETLKTQIASKKYYKENDEAFEIEAGKLREYAYVMAKEESNVYWWLTATRNAMYDINNVDEGDTLKKADVKALETSGKIVCKAMNSSFNSMTAEEKSALKELYNFGDNLFQEAVSQGKKAMVILGTWQANESDFADYVAATIAYYGTDDYVYYYKGHPRNPTPTVDGKMEYLNSLGLTDVDSTIAAELLFFYYSDLLVCTGYDSSTYSSLTDAQSGSIWNFAGGETSFNTSGKTYINNIDACFTVADSANADYGTFVNASNKTILIEVLDSTDLYLYDTVTETLTHLVDNLGSYEVA